MEQTFKPKNSLFIIFVCLVPLFPYFSSISSIPLHFLLCSPAHIPPAHPPPPGTFILTLIGKGAAVSLANLEVPHHSCLLPPDQAPAGVTLGLGSLAGGLGVMVGILVTGRWGSLSPSSPPPARSSGAHLNPQVSLAFAVTGDLPFTCLPAYMLAQYLGQWKAGVKQSNQCCQGLGSPQVWWCCCTGRA